LSSNSGRPATRSIRLRWSKKFEDGRDFDWDDLRQLTRRSAEIDQDRITRDCVRGFSFLAAPTPEEERLAHDSYQREQALYEELKESLPSLLALVGQFPGIP
jgi:hypothetical protein